MEINGNPNHRQIIHLYNNTSNNNNTNNNEPPPPPFPLRRQNAAPIHAGIMDNIDALLRELHVDFTLNRINRTLIVRNIPDINRWNNHVVQLNNLAQLAPLDRIVVRGVQVQELTRLTNNSNSNNNMETNHGGRRRKNRRHTKRRNTKKSKKSRRTMKNKKTHRRKRK